jgi:beta-galactosidase
MKKTCWNDGWKFWKEGNAFSLVWNVPENARELTLPHDAMLEEAADPESSNGGNTGFRNGGVYVYVKNICPCEEDLNGKTALFFEGVYMNASVYVDGQLAARRPYGYSGFEADLTPYLHAGKTSEIRVIAKNGAMANSRWYSGGGILRDVWLLRSENTYLPYEGLRIRTEDAEEELAVLHADVEVKNASANSRKLAVRTSILDAEKKICGKETTKVFLLPGEQRTIQQKITVKNPLLWSDENPVLYHAETVLSEEDTELDREESNFGIRTLTLDSVRGLRVNGKSVKLRGACIHSDSGVLGGAVYYEEAVLKMKALKEAGFNAVRISHQPAAPAWLKACDELGLYVMDELTDMWNRCKSDYDYGLYFEDWWERDAEAMVRKDYNHPSVILYSIGNEIPEIGTDQGSSLAHAIADKFHTLDSTRFTTAGINGVFAAGDRVPEIMQDLAAEDGGADGNVNDFMTVMDTRMDDIVVHPAVSERLDMACEALDAAGYNYMTARYEKDLIEHPNRVIVGTETYPPEIARNWMEVKKCPNVIGDFTWTGWDYIGEAGVGVPAYHFGEGGFGAAFPCQLAYCGDFDLIGNRRPASFYREIAFGLRKAPYLAVEDPAHYGEKLIKTPWVISDASHSWTYPDMEGKQIVVEVYGKGYEAELLINGRSQGREKITAPGANTVGNRVLFTVVYEPGSLETVLYDENGREIGRDQIETTKTPAVLKAEAENMDDLHFIRFALEDEDGKAIDTKSFDSALTVTETENINLLGLGSGDPKPVHNFTESVTDTFYGSALAVCRLEDPEKEGKLTAVTGDGKSVSVLIHR